MLLCAQPWSLLFAKCMLAMPIKSPVEPIHGTAPSSAAVGGLDSSSIRPQAEGKMLWPKPWEMRCWQRNVKRGVGDLNTLWQSVDKTGPEIFQTNSPSHKPYPAAASTLSSGQRGWSRWILELHRSSSLLATCLSSLASPRSAVWITLESFSWFTNSILCERKIVNFLNIFCVLVLLVLINMLWYHRN